MGSNPCRIIPLLGIAHPVEGKIILGTEGSYRDVLEKKKWPCMSLLCIFFFLFFCKNLGKRPSFG